MKSVSKSGPDNSPPRHVLAGGSGMLGQALASALMADGADVVVLTRSPDAYRGPGRAVGWDGETAGAWAGELDGAASVVNLAGASVASRWTGRKRGEILVSRTNSVRAVERAVRRCDAPPAVWLQASAVGIYGDRGDAILPDDAAIPQTGAGFLVEVCRLWETDFERAASAAQDFRPVTLRIGVVLGRGGGAWPALRMLTKGFLGGRVGDGRQWVPWIHQQDWTAAVRFLMGRPDLSGVFNLVGPNPARNAELMAATRSSLGRPPALPAPAWAMRLGQRTLGLPAETVLASQRAVPARLLAAGFTFEFPTLDAAVENLR